MMRDEPPVIVNRLSRHPRLPALLTYAGQVPAIAAQAGTIAGAALLIGIPAGYDGLSIVALAWRKAVDRNGKSRVTAATEVAPPALSTRHAA